MPAGTPKVTMFGDKTIAPGGCQTFNTSGTFTVPVGVTVINLVGKGGSGNPGNAGNSGGCGAERSVLVRLDMAVLIRHEQVRQGGVR